MANETTRGLDTSDTGAGQEPAPVGKRHLLVIGISKYKTGSGFSDLVYPEKDAENFSRLLFKEYGFDHVKRLVNDECTTNGIVQCIVEYKKSLGKDDYLVVLFSGHGAIKDQIGYWIAHDANQTLELNLEIDKVLKLLIGCCKQVLLIVDCCFSGAAVEQAYLDAVYNKVKLETTKFSVVTSGNIYQKVPDKSLFMEALLEMLSTKTILNLEQLVGDLKVAIGNQCGTTITSFISNDQSGLPFILQRKDQASFELKEAFYELNYTKQTTHIKGIRLFNLVYLRGTNESGHHFFTQRYFMENGFERLREFFHAPEFITFGKEAQNPEYSIWSKIGSQMGYPTADPKSIINRIFRELESKSWVWIAKVDNNCDNDSLETALMDFWKQMNEYILSVDRAYKSSLQHKMFFFIWDRRGDAEEAIPKSLWSGPYDVEFVKPFHLPPIEPLEVNPDLLDWYHDIINSHKKYNYLRKEQAFTTDNIRSVHPPLTIANVICQIAKVCKRQEVYDLLFKQETLWPQ